MPEPTGPALANLSFEAALEQLDLLIGKLEAGQIPLDDAVKAYEQGMALAQHCAGLLDRTEATISQLVMTPGGVSEAPLQLSDVSSGADQP